MRGLILLFFPLALALALSCPSGFSDGGDGSCYSTSSRSATRNTAYGICAKDGAYLYDVSNAFQNTGVQQRAGGASRIWLGLTCSQSDIRYCNWDYGTPIYYTSYTNFYGGSPNVDNGSCVYMDVKSGYWYNADCSLTNITFGCKYTPSLSIPLCQSPQYDIVTFRNHCYFPIFAYSFDDAAAICSNECATVASIHSTAENTFVKSLIISGSDYNTYMLTGLQHDQGSSPCSFGSTGYHWNDTSFVDYCNFGYENVQLGKCVGLAVRDDLVKIGQWINIDCGGALPAVCKRDLNTTCAPPTTVPPTLSPEQCTSPNFYSGIGTIYSPGYPVNNTLTNTCEYLITEDQGQTAAIHFRQLRLGDRSQITFFSGISDTTPFQIITSYNYSYVKDVYSSTNIIRMYYSSLADGSYWVADYDNGRNGTEVGTTTPSYSGGSPCNSTFYGNGMFGSENYPSVYPFQTKSCVYTADSQTGTTCAYFDYFNIRNGDYVDVWDGPTRLLDANLSDYNPPYGVYCSYYSRSITVILKSNQNSYNPYAKGFQVKYGTADYVKSTPSTTSDPWRTTYPSQPTSTTPGYPWMTTVRNPSVCGQEYFNTGWIYTDNFPQSYPSVDKTCNYFLNSRGIITCVTFISFEIRMYDNVTLYDGYNTGRELAMFTQYDKPSGIYCSDYYSQMKVVLKSSSILGGYVRGFEARFAASAAYLQGSTTASPTATPFPYTWKV